MPSAKGPLVVSYLGGPLSFQEEAGLPFQIDVIRAIEQLGLRNESVAVVEAAFPDAPKLPPMPPPQASLTVALIIGFAGYLAGKLGDKAVDKIIDQLYENVVGPRLRRHWHKLTRAASGHPLVATFDHWFDETGVLVRIEYYGSADDAEVPDVAALVPLAVRLAEKHVLAHGVTHRVLCFEVRDGNLWLEPKLLAALPAPGGQRPPDGGGGRPGLNATGA